MDAAHDIADSTDWLNTPLAALSDLENALHCQICKEFYDTPMITSCSHTFCSKCIRTSLSSDGRCPACRTADQSSKLRNNWQLQEVVAAFLAARPQTLKVAREEREQEGAARRVKRKRAVLDSDDVAAQQDTSRSTRRKSRRIAASQGSQPEAIEVDDSDDDFEPEKPQDDGLVECPLGCGKRMKIESVEPHLDRCEDEKLAAKRAKSRTPVIPSGNARSSARSTPRPQDRISELNYSLLKDNAIRKKFEELGIPAFGSKQLMIRRHTEWVNLWNANCDSSNPRTKRELLQDLDTWERTQGGRAPQVNLGPAMLRKDFDGATWASKNKDDFSRLIADARRKKSTPPVAPDDEATSKEKMTDGVKQSDTAAGPYKDATKPHTSEEDAIPREQPPTNTPGITVSPFQQEDPASVPNETSLNANHDSNPPPPPTKNAHESNSSTSSTADSAHLSPSLPETSAPLPGVENPALLSQAHFGVERPRSSRDTDRHFTKDMVSEACNMPAHMLSAPVKKMPMFALPGEPVKDMDGAEQAR